MEFLGTSIIGFRDGNAGKAGDAGNGAFQAFAPASGQKSSLPSTPQQLRKLTSP